MIRNMRSLREYCRLIVMLVIVAMLVWIVGCSDDVEYTPISMYDEDDIYSVEYMEYIDDVVEIEPSQDYLQDENDVDTNYNDIVEIKLPQYYLYDSDFGRRVAEEFLREYLSLFSLAYYLDNGEPFPFWGIPMYGVDGMPLVYIGSGFNIYGASGFNIFDKYGNLISDDVPFINYGLIASTFRLYDFDDNGIPDIVIRYSAETWGVEILYRFIDGEYRNVGRSMHAWVEFHVDEQERIIVIDGSHGGVDISYLTFTVDGAEIEHITGSDPGFDDHEEFLAFWRGLPSVERLDAIEMLITESIHESFGLTPINVAEEIALPTVIQPLDIDVSLDDERISELGWQVAREFLVNHLTLFDRYLLFDAEPPIGESFGLFNYVNNGIPLIFVTYRDEVQRRNETNRYMAVYKFVDGEYRYIGQFYHCCADLRADEQGRLILVEYLINENRRASYVIFTDSGIEFELIDSWAMFEDEEHETFRAFSRTTMPIRLNTADIGFITLNDSMRKSLGLAPLPPREPLYILDGRTTPPEWVSENAERDFLRFIAWNHPHSVISRLWTSIRGDGNSEIFPEVNTLYTILRTYDFETELGTTFETADCDWYAMIPIEMVHYTATVLYNLEDDAIIFDESFLNPDNLNYFNMPLGVISSDTVHAYILWDKWSDMGDNIYRFDVWFLDNPRDDPYLPGQTVNRIGYEVERVLYRDKIVTYRFRFAQVLFN